MYINFLKLILKARWGSAFYTGWWQGGPIHGEVALILFIHFKPCQSSVKHKAAKRHLNSCIWLKLRVHIIFQKGSPRKVTFILGRGQVLQLRAGYYIWWLVREGWKLLRFLFLKSPSLTKNTCYWWVGWLFCIPTSWLILVSGKSPSLNSAGLWMVMVPSYCCSISMLQQPLLVVSTPSTPLQTIPSPKGLLKHPC